MEKFEGARVPVIKVNGIKNIQGMEFHDIEGGFGEGKKAMLVKEIANIHNRELKAINQNINNNIERFKKDVDIIDLLNGHFELPLESLGFSRRDISISKNIYLLSERGYAKLLKILEDDVAWEQYDKLVDGYFNMRETIKSGQAKFATQEDMFIYQLQEQKKIKQQLNEVNHRALSAKQDIEKLEKDFINYKENQHISGAERDEISSLVKAIGTRELGGKGSKAYKDESLRRKVYSNIYRELYNQFNITSYKYIRAKYFTKAKEIVYNYRLTIALKEAIEVTNSQIQFEEAN